MKENSSGSRPSLTRFPLSEAEDCIAYYKQRASVKGIDKVNLVKAYLLQTEDIFEALGVSSTGTITLTNNRVRVYLGMKEMDDETARVYKMFLVPVDDYGVDIIPQGQINGTGPVIDYVYDFNTPCPNTCDETSPLFKAGE